MITRTLRSLADTHALAARIAEFARVGDVIVLAGEMGAGKTAFAQGFGRALGVTEPVTSPTFNVVHSYDSGRVRLHHADVYRLERTGELDDLSLGELDDGILLVEWGDVVASSLGEHLEIVLSRVDDDDDARVVTIEPVGPRWNARWSRIEAALA
ncbi:MAG: tRNA (adenosine(37)-N6)-threonylcarbamoyltransferase complex ATPase subunit type 1 TsaE [Acidimicrobiales bacterium mtb01]|nr:tRNA (adenosine(37)-N6)-threonylcarbamoyltransferase complex ATPase subunit type 1 TsaE [Actinomycetota bacterium]TEX47230.1 MAG: tRNA (adenosine(37)-N6)-threonylcarbamoyltransferase complex ATPase subunit type 1 TsaE [Acidimicrobiales bacterium mtb01]